MATQRDRELEDLDEQDERERVRLLSQTRQDIAAVIANPEGLARLKSITDEEWEEAVAQDLITAAGTDETA